MNTFWLQFFRKCLPVFVDQENLKEWNCLLNKKPEMDQVIHAGQVIRDASKHRSSEQLRVGHYIIFVGSAIKAICAHIFHVLL